jgi:proline iminopeptidase
MKKIFFFIIAIAAVNVFPQTKTEKINHPEGSYVLVNGSKLWIETEGNGEPVLLIPGGPGNSHTYLHPWFSELAKNFKVIYLDAFGRGKSDRAKSTDEYTFKRDVEDIEVLRKALKIEKWIVLGHSYGGMVAQAYALEYPSAVDKLILSNSFYSGEMWQANNDNCNYEFKNQYPEAWEKLQKLRDQGFNSSSDEHVSAYTLPSGLLYFYNPENVNKVRSDSLIMNLKVYYTLVGYDGDFIIGGDVSKLDFRKELKNLKMPSLIIEGRFDRVAVPRWSVKFKEYAPQAKFVMFEKSGHNPYIEETEKYFKVLNGFMSNGK